MPTLNRNIKFFKVLVWSICLFSALIVGVLYNIKPNITKQVLESKEFHAEISQRFKELTGLDLTLQNVNSKENLAFAIESIKIANNSKEHAPNCILTGIEGKLKDSWKIADIEYLKTSYANCSIYIDENNFVMGINSKYDPQLDDLKIIFGAEINKLNVNRLDTNVYRIVNNKIAESFGIEKMKLEIDASLSLSNQLASVRLYSEEQKTHIKFQANRHKNTPIMKAYISPNIALSIENNQPAIFAASLKIHNQDFVEALDTDTYPMSLSLNGNIPNTYTANIDKAKINMKNLLDISTSAIFNMDHGVLQGDFKNLDIKTSDEGFAITGLPSNGQEFISFKGGTAKVYWNDLKSKDFIFSAHLGDSSFDLTKTNSTQIKGLALHLEVDTHRSPSYIPYHFKISTNSIKNNLYLVSAKKPWISSEGVIQDNLESLRIDNLSFGSDEEKSKTHLQGLISLWDENSKINLAGNIHQDLSPFYFKDSQVDGKVDGKFSIYTDPKGNFQIDSKINGKINKIIHPELFVKNITFNSMIKTTMTDGLHTDLIASGDENIFLNEIENAFSQFEGNLKIKGELIKIKETKDSINSEISIAGVEWNGTFSQKDFATANGFFQLAKLKTTSLDGVNEKWSQTPIYGNWTLINEGEGGLNINTFMKSPYGHDSLLNLNANLVLENNDLLVSYNSEGSVSKLLQQYSDVELLTKEQSIRLSGNIRLPNFTSDVGYDDWAIKVFNLPYQESVYGKATAFAYGVEIDEEGISNLKIPQLTANIEHFGPIERQSFKGDISAAKVQANVITGQQFDLSQLYSEFDGFIELPFPSPNGEIDLRGRADSFASAGNNIPNVTFNIKAIIKDGAIENVKANHSLDGSIPPLESILAH